VREGGRGGEGEEGEGVRVLPSCQIAGTVHSSGSEEASETKEDKERRVETSEGQLASFALSWCPVGKRRRHTATKASGISERAVETKKTTIHILREKQRKRYNLARFLQDESTHSLCTDRLSVSPTRKGGTSQYRLKKKKSVEWQ
jgi:hypothetical protein